ncbi:hypothetical protein B0H11DRAFT_1943973 [Mycena galericulata]|nr:hypothetical protein B0H11DRAFT_1943973 [Mycena galericulata]
MGPTSSGGVPSVFANHFVITSRIFVFAIWWSVARPVNLPLFRVVRVLQVSRLLALALRLDVSRSASCGAPADVLNRSHGSGLIACQLVRFGALHFSHSVLGNAQVGYGMGDGSKVTMNGVDSEREWRQDKEDWKIMRSLLTRALGRRVIGEFTHPLSTRWAYLDIPDERLHAILKRSLTPKLVGTSSNQVIPSSSVEQEGSDIVPDHFDGDNVDFGQFDDDVPVF